MAVLVVVAAAAHAFYAWRSEEAIRIAGYSLQLLSMVLAIRGVMRARTYFGHPPLRQLFVNWLGRFPRWKSKIVSAGAKGQISAIGGQARAKVWTPDKPDRPLEERFEDLLKNVDRLRSAQGEIEQRIDRVTNDLDEHRKKTATQNEETKQDVQRKLETLHTDGWQEALVGLIWLMLGLSFAALAPELSSLR